jgi:hypothetical protein
MTDTTTGTAGTLTATRVAPAADAPLTEHVNTLLARETRAYLLGTVEADEARGEGAVVRVLLVNAIERLRQIDPDDYARRVALGAAELDRRAAERQAAGKS